MPLLEDCTGPITYIPLENTLAREEVQPKKRKPGQGDLRDRTCRLQEAKQRCTQEWCRQENFEDSFVDQKRLDRNRKKKIMTEVKSSQTLVEIFIW